ncbi:MAG: hypothetical protein K8R39_07230 [Arcobacteraceae bacterium]|nr:hypothetical protein [Arcobacteraceae bacterium]
MLKSNFEQLPFRQKVELYFIIPIFFTIIFIFLQKLLIIKEPNIVQQQLSVKSLSDKIVVKNNKEIMDYIETQIAKHDIFVQAMTTSNHTISLNINSSFDPLIEFLYILEQHLIIEEFSLDRVEPNSKMIKSRVVFLSEYFVNPTQKEKIVKNIKNPFFQETKTIVLKEENTIINKSQSTMLQVDAIVTNEVLIQGDWYKKGDIFQKIKIVQIEPTVVKVLHQETNTIEIIRLDIDEK